MRSSRLKLKLELLCRGIRLDPPTRKKFQGYRQNKRASLSEGVCFNIGIGSESFVVNLAVHEKFVSSTPFSYSSIDHKLLCDGQAIASAYHIDDPSWFQLQLPDGTRYGEVLSVHLTNILAVALNDQCLFKTTSEGCRFCGLEAGRSPVKKDPSRIAQVIKGLESRGYKFTELNINSGTLEGPDRGAEVYMEVIREVRKVSSIPIAAQICPPANLSYFQHLCEAGLQTISFNIEIFDDEIRREICPGKSRISMPEYLLALEEAVKIFGRNQVSSWLIAGLEPKESTIAGAEAIARTGAIPFVTVFRPLLGTSMEDLSPPPVEDLLDIFEELKKIFTKYQLNPFASTCGCVNCDCCSALTEMLGTSPL